MSIFSKIGKAVGKVAKKAIVGTIARTVVGSVPVLGGVVSAVGAVKSALHPPTTANTANVSSVTGRPAFGHPGIMHSHSRATRPHPRARRTTGARRKTTRRASARRAGGVSAKQRAARARFAKAAKRGPIRKGSHL